MLRRFKFLFFIFIVSISLKAEDNFVFGLGGSFLSTPAYIGSKKQNYLVLPFPYIEYTGKYFSIDRDKIYNELYNNEKTQIEISLRGMLPVKSENTAREGMPDLDAIVEIGPKITYNLFSKNDMKINLELPLRAAFSLGDNFFDYEGYYSSFDLSYKNIIFDEYNLSFTSGVSYSDKKINNYYYEVSNQYSNNKREEYHSKGGYSGFHNGISLTKKDDEFWYGGFLKHYYIDKAVFENSSLVETKNSIMYGLALSYLF